MNYKMNIKCIIKKKAAKVVEIKTQSFRTRKFLLDYNI